MFTVFASDGIHEGRTEVKINLTDVNDVSPRFPSDQTYIGYVQENRPAGTSVMYVQAVDDDDPFSGGNAKIKYDLANSAGNKFSINADTGLIESRVKFNRDTTPKPFTVTVRATDQGSKNQLSSTKDATIYILDGNNNKPAFTQRIYRGTVPENAPPGYRVAAVSATDGDTGPNAELEFVVTNGNEPHSFYLNPFNGTVHVSGIIDYEVKKSYNLTVTVADRGMPPLEADKPAYVIITVTDTNDNAPVFVPDQYNTSVSEGVKEGTVVVKVTATDKDSGTNAKFDFSITKGNEDDLFKVVPDPKNPSIGLVMTRLPLDREKIPVHHLEITATDSGGLKDQADVWLTLDDVNDNGPWFQPPYFEGKVKENTDAAQFVTRLSAYDPDSPTNGGPFTYSIVNGTLSNNFRLVEPATYKNATSNVNSYGRFDRETTATWKIGVAAVDSGKPKKTNFTYLYVDVMDDNDNEPFDGSMVIVVNAYKGEFIGGPIGKPYYKDADYDGDVNTYVLYRQLPGSYFKVDPNSGNITADPKIPIGKYILNIKVTESSSSSGPRRNAVNFPKTVTSSVRVLVRRIDPIAVNHSVALQFTDMRKVGYFVGDNYGSVVSVISGNLGVSRDKVEVFSVQKAPDRLLSVNVQFAVKDGDSYMKPKDGDSYMKPKDVIDKLTDKKAEFIKLGESIFVSFIYYCLLEFAISFTKSLDK
jgi:protocadherin Fat 1/2/3